MSYDFSSHRMLHHVGAMLSLLVGLFLPNVAFAQAPSDAQLAQALFDEAREWMDKNDFAKACPLLERSEKLDPGGGTLLNLGLCYEGAGRIAKAYTTINDALSLARRDGRKDREEIALHHLDAISPRLPRLRISLASLPDAVFDSMIVRIDEMVMGPTILGVLTPIDPGVHHIRISAQGRVPWEWNGTIAEGERRELDAVLPLPPPPNPCDVPGACLPPPPPKPKKRISTGSFVAMGVAGVSTITTIVTGALALTAKSDFENNCIPSRQYCSDPKAGASDYDRMRNMAWASTISLGIAGVAVLVAIVWPRTIVAPKATGLAIRF